MGWIEDLEEQEKIEQIKAVRPLCMMNYPQHTWIKFQSMYEQECIICGYREELVCNDQ